MRESLEPLGVAGRLVCWVTLLLLCALILPACGHEPDTSSAPMERIVVAYPKTLLSILFNIALTKGFFHEQGLEIDSQFHEYGKVALDSLLEDKADLAIVADTPVMFAITGGRKVDVIGVTATCRRGNAIVGKKDRGIFLPADLKGKTIGVVPGTTSHFFLDSFLSMHGMTLGQVNAVDIKPGTILDGLLSGRLDAVSIWNPTLIELRRKLKDQAIVFYDEAIYSDVSCIAARPEFLKAHPETVKRFLRGLLGAEHFIEQNPEESRRLTSEFLQMDRGILDEIWNSYSFRVTLGQSLILSLEDQTRWAQRNGLPPVATMPNYLDFIHFDGLLAVKPSAVKIIR
jgi:ABC-type nitrate/sulfonate/bicarbonate transport system substrate-binding protein